jgi:hypothetical protein
MTGTKLAPQIAMRAGRTITICAYNRPQYLRQVLDSLHVALKHSQDAGYDWDIVVGIDRHAYDGNESYPDQTACAVEASHSRFNLQIICWAEHLGVAEHPRRLIQYAFSELKSSYNVHLEDDTVLSPDALLFAMWYYHAAIATDYTNYQSVHKTLCLSLHSKSGAEALDYPSSVGYRSDFGVWGWACTNNAWRTWFSQYWNYKRTEPFGFDYSISRMMHEHDLYAVCPALSRVTNIGREGGAHQTPAGFDLEMEGLVAAGPQHLTGIKGFYLDPTKTREDWKHGE